MKTITVQIGNSDNKLRQVEWADFVETVKNLIASFAVEIYFFGGSSNWESWQNACWVFCLNDYDVAKLNASLTVVRKRYKQESLAWTAGQTVFI
ncbi:MAG: hypothetical protein WCS42_04645 [Verrucomicrobiota bacterium]